MTGVKSINTIEPFTRYEFIDRISEIRVIQWASYRKNRLHDNASYEPICTTFVSIPEGNKLENPIYGEKSDNDNISIDVESVGYRNGSKEKYKKQKPEREDFFHKKVLNIPQ